MDCQKELLRTDEERENSNCDLTPQSAYTPHSDDAPNSVRKEMTVAVVGEGV